MQTLDFPAIRTRVQAVMAAQQLSQRALAKKAGIAQGGLSDFLSGKAESLTLANVTALGTALGEDFWIADGANGVRQAATPGADWRRISLDRLRPSKANPRKTFGKADLDELAESIAAHGLLQNLVVRPAAQSDVEPRYELVAGERRFRALLLLVKAKRLPADHPVPCKVVDAFDDADHLAAALVENIQREQVAPLEEAAAFKRLVGWGWDTARIAGAVHRSRRHVQLRLALVDRLGEPARKALAQGTITLAHARELATVGATLQKEGLAELTGSVYSAVKTAAQLRKHLHRNFVPVDKALLPPPPNWTAPADDQGRSPGGVVEVDGALMFESRRAFSAWQADAVERRRQVLADQWAWVDVVERYDWNRDRRGYGAVVAYQWDGEPSDLRKPVTSDDRTAAGAVIVFDRYAGEAAIHEGILRAPEAAEDAEDAAGGTRATHRVAPAGARATARFTVEKALRHTAATAPTLWRRALLFGCGGGSVALMGFDDIGMGGLEADPALGPLLDDDGEWRDPAAAWAALTALPTAELDRLAGQVLADTVELSYNLGDLARDPVLQAIAAEYGLDLGLDAAEAAE